MTCQCREGYVVSGLFCIPQPVEPAAAIVANDKRCIESAECAKIDNAECKFNLVRRSSRLAPAVLAELREKLKQRQSEAGGEIIAARKKGKKKKQGRQVVNDIIAGKNAMRLIFRLWTAKNKIIATLTLSYILTSDSRLPH
jgi:hypothetical protein